MTPHVQKFWISLAGDLWVLRPVEVDLTTSTSPRISAESSSTVRGLHSAVTRFVQHWEKCTQSHSRQKRTEYKVRVLFLPHLLPLRKNTAIYWCYHRVESSFQCARRSKDQAREARSLESRGKALCFLLLGRISSISPPRKPSKAFLLEKKRSSFPANSTSIEQCVRIGAKLHIHKIFIKILLCWLFAVLLLKLWSTDLQQKHLLGTCEKCGVPSPTPDLLNQNPRQQDLQKFPTHIKL